MRLHQNTGEQFTDFGVGRAFTFIPHNEGWLDQESEKDEYPFYVENMLTMNKLMKGGMGYEQALEKSNRREVAMREKYTGKVGRLPGGDGTKQAHIMELMQIEYSPVAG